MTNIKKLNFLPAVFFVILVNSLYAQTDFPAGDYWSLDAGLGMSGVMADGLSFQAIIDPKLWLSPSLMAGSKAGVNYSAEANSDESNILAFEGQVYLRWNFLRFGRPEKSVNIFAQGGIGLLAAYRGVDNPFDDVKLTRGSLLADASLGVTIPLSERWHIEPSIRGGYPHIAGFSLTAGYKIPLPQKTQYQISTNIEYVEIIKMLPPEEIIKVMMISSVEYVLFGPDIGKYNTGIEHDARELNEMVLNSTAQLLKDNSDLRVRVEGHANPVTNDPNEADELMALSAMRSNAVADQLRERGISDEQMVVISFGGTRNITSEHEIWDRNRRVELIVIQVDAGQN